MPMRRLNVMFREINEGSYEIDVDVPQGVLDGDDLSEWVENNVPDLHSRALANGNMDSSTFEVVEAEDLGEA